MLGTAGFEAWPLSRLLTVSSFGVGLGGLYNRSTQNLLQKSPACERHLPLRLLSRLSQVCELHHGASHISRFPAPPAGLHGRLPALCPADLFLSLWLLPTTLSPFYLKDV